MRANGRAALALLFTAAAVAGCGTAAGAGAGHRRFTTRIDNPYWPMRPGSRWVSRELVAGEPAHRVVVTVTHRTRRIANGVTARVVHDVVSRRGRVLEDTYDWYAQDRAGTVWYLGEHTTEYAPGEPPSTEGSWEAGVGGARAGIVVPAHPRVGMRYRQELLRGVAEDRARVLSVDEQAQVPAGHWSGVLLTRESTSLEPRVLEYKLYARGVGPVLALTVSGGAEREELLRFELGVP